MKNGKVVLVGAGMVGMSMAYTMLNRGGVSELVLIDIDKDRTVGEEMDLNHGMPFAPQKMIIKAGDYDECKDAHIVVITAGVPQKPGETRLQLAEKNTSIIKISKVSGLPKNQVIGSGTVLDTARLRFILSEKLNVYSKNIHAYIMGEHGDSSFVPWDHAYVGCKKIKDVVKEKGKSVEELEEIHKQVVNAAYEIINKKRATYLGMCLSKICKAIIDNDNSILTVSTYLKDGEYGQDDIFIGVPAIVNAKGVRELLELELTKEEQEKLDNSCKIIKEMRETSIDKMINE